MVHTLRQADEIVLVYNSGLENAEEHFKERYCLEGPEKPLEDLLIRLDLGPMFNLKKSPEGHIVAYR